MGGEGGGRESHKQTLVSGAPFRLDLTVLRSGTEPKPESQPLN